MDCQSDEHGYAKQQAAKETGPRDEKKNGTCDLDHARDVTELYEVTKPGPGGRG